MKRREYRGAVQDGGEEHSEYAYVAGRGCAGAGRDRGCDSNKCRLERSRRSNKMREEGDRRSSSKRLPR